MTTWHIYQLVLHAPGRRMDAQQADMTSQRAGVGRP
jgi:hypothetical protein